MASSPTTTATSSTPTTSCSTSRTRPMTVRESLAMLGKGSTTPTATKNSGHQKSTSRTSGGASGDQALNLSTKKGSFGDTKQDSAERSASKASSLLANFDSGLGSIPNIFGNLSAESRIPLINLRDGSRLTGKEAPMLKDLAAFLYKNQHYMIDMMAQSGLGMDHDLEPGEIVRNASSKAGGESRSTPKSSTTTTKTTVRTSFGASSSSSIGDPYTHVSVVNRKNGLKLSGQKAPQLKNLAVWLEKNPDWDVDLSDLAQQTQPQSSKSSTSHDKEAKTSSSKSHTSKDAKSSSSTSKSMPLGMSPFDFLLAGGGSLSGFDPWTSLFTGGLPSMFSNQSGGSKSSSSNSAENAAAAAAAAALFPFLNPFLTSSASGTSPSFGSFTGANFGGGTSTSSAHNSPSLRQHSPNKAAKTTSNEKSSK
uniref:BRK domain-containing protein n=1 Tax=Romanomermis culicivorax TaxID=13658 RepID=A0A915K9I7_ROMCU